MSTVVLFDGQSCCSPVRGREESAQAVAQFVADAQWLQEQGVAARRVTISSAPEEFAGTPTVAELISAQGMNALPALTVDGKLVVSGRYPARAELAQWCGLRAPDEVAPDAPTDAGTCCAPVTAESGR